MPVGIADVRHFIENASDVIYTQDLEGRILSVNAAAEKLFGVPRSEAVGQQISQFIVPEHREIAIAATMKKLAEGGGSTTYTIDVVTKSGQRVPLEVATQLIYENGRPVAVQGIARDITERKKAAEALADSERALFEREHFFRSIIERSSDILVVVDGTMLVRYVSPAFTTILGFTSEDLIGRHGTELVHPDDAGKAEELSRAIFEKRDEYAATVLRARDKSGGYHVFDVRARNLLDDPLFRGVVIDARDITEAKRTEEALRESEQRFRKILETSAEGVAIRNPAGRLTFVNDRFAQMLGYQVDEMIGLNVFDIVVNEYRAQMAESAERRKRTGKAEQLDLEFLHKTGSRISILLSASPLYDADGNYIGSLGMLTDISERKNLEAQLRQSQKIEAVGRLAGGIAHDFNNLLTAIRGHVDLLLADTPVEAHVRSDIEEIGKAADRAAGLTQQLLAFSRRQILQPRVIELDTVVTDMETLLRRMINEDIRLLTRLRSGNACVRADRSQLEQVLMNLAVNARDAMPNGGTLTIETSVVDIDEEFVRANNGSHAGRHVRLCVTDSGAGMDAETLSHVFEPFFTTKELGKGTGLGLATVYGVVKQSDGYIRVESEPRAGTTFEILLPAVKAVTEAPRDLVFKPGSAGKGETILVAEDEDAVRSLASRILRKRGYNVLEAKNGVEAMELARAHRGTIDLLLTDVIMPVLGGRELGERLGELRPGTKVLFMSGYTDDALLQRGVLQGDGQFLEKPFSPEGLAAKIREVLESTSTD
ncbi:MAG TPA: PAS domain S-box protein [Longimicrobiales bacterium]|nr:PAS domain S-box protein [Longimicrobiales bacterium]